MKWRYVVNYNSNIEKRTVELKTHRYREVKKILRDFYGNVKILYLKKI